MSPALSLDIFGLIADHLDEDDKSSILHFALVSRALRDLIEPKLYRRVELHLACTIGIESSVEQTKSAKFLQALKIGRNTRHVEELVVFSFEGYETHDTAINEILPLLPRLRSLTYKTQRSRSFFLPTSAPFSLKRLVYTNDYLKDSSLTTELRAFLRQQPTINHLDLFTAIPESILPPASLPELRILHGHLIHIHPWLTAQPRHLSHLWISGLGGEAAERTIAKHIITKPDQLQSVKFFRCDSKHTLPESQVSLASSLCNLELLELDPALGPCEDFFDAMHHLIRSCRGHKLRGIRFHLVWPPLDGSVERELLDSIPPLLFQAISSLRVVDFRVRHGESERWHRVSEWDIPAKAIKRIWWNDEKWWHDWTQI